MQAVGVGDLHYDGTISNHVPDGARFITEQLVRGPLSYAERKAIRHVFLYGDVCSKPRMSYPSHLSLMKAIKDHKHLQFHFILGNHDMYGKSPSAGHSLQLLAEANLPNVTIYTKPKLTSIDGAKVKFLPYPHNNFSSKSLNVAHIDVAGAKRDNGYPTKTEFDSDAVAVIGHIHTAQTIRRTHYSGTLYQTRFGEPEEKFFHHIRFNNPDDYYIRLVPYTPTSRLCTVVVNSRKDIRNLSSSEGQIYRLVINDGAEVEPNDWEHINVAQTNPFSTKEDLNDILKKSVSEGERIKISIPEFLEAHFTASGEKSEEVESLLNLRVKVLQKAA